jgi:glycosyltransferase involved in cell wall biosynthesis
LISVVMAAYNAASYIGPAIESILKQRFREFELLIVDDGSTDDTAAISHRYAQQDGRIRVLANDRNCGNSYTLNVAMQNAQYDWIAVQDADDVALPERLETQAACIARHPHVIAWGAGRRFINDEGRLLYISELGPKSEAEFHAQRRAGEPVMLAHPTFVFRKSLGQKVGGYDTRFVGALDLEFMDRLSDHGVMLAIPDALVLYRVHARSATATKFMRQEYEIRYVYERRLGIQAGKPALTWAEYEARALSKGLFTRLWEARQSYGRLFWYRAGIARGERRLIPATALLAGSLALTPQTTGRKLTAQVRKRRVE